MDHESPKFLVGAKRPLFENRAVGQVSWYAKLDWDVDGIPVVIAVIETDPEVGQVAMENGAWSTERHASVETHRLLDSRTR